MIRGTIFSLVAVVSTLFFSTVGLLAGLFHAGPGVFDWIHRNWARAMLRAAGAKLDVDGLQHIVPGEAQLLVANHQSMVDIWALMAAVPASVRFVAKAELAKIPVFAGATRAAGHVFIDRGRPQRAAEAIREATERMRRDGLTLVLFPEGTRSSGDGRLGRFLRGSFALAIETQARLVPAAIEGGRRVLPRGTWRPRAGTLSIRFAPAIDLKGMEPEDRDALMERTRAEIDGMLGEVRHDEGSGSDPAA